MEQIDTKLSQLSTANPDKKKAIVKKADQDLIYTIGGICECVIKGYVPLSQTRQRRLRRYKQNIRKLANKDLSIRKKKKIIQKGGGFLQFVIPAVAGLLEPIIGKIFT